MFLGTGKVRWELIGSLDFEIDFTIGAVPGAHVVEGNVKKSKLCANNLPIMPDRRVMYCFLVA